ncbi:hypothetical protein GCM10009718_18430 [Isoptericola halotolerans]|uniref:DUF1684 domain-containing protein n=1 Tax=Isoptericola halotolerans TaxID=300560 RepID=A0ABX2A974_9MICO|nr:hypothetical protein [Isoptericola halotolerans]NOV98570.1 hypothetical protein [Isoptericola halotolerans]
MPADRFEELTCDGEPVPPGVVESIDDLRTAIDLRDEARAALDGAEVPPIDPAEWAIVTESPERVALLRELDEPEDLGGGDVRTHEFLTIERVDGPRWMLTSANSCALRSGPAEPTDAYGQADLTLDPDHPLDPAATEIHLLVTERACNSGQDAEGRIVLDRLAATDDAIDLVIGVTLQEGNFTCPSNPPTPFVVELEAPLGDRVVRDAAVVPPRELEPAG